MAKKPKDRVELGNEQGLTHNPFAALLGNAVSSSTAGTDAESNGVEPESGAQGTDSTHASDASARVEVRRERKGRGGKVVTLVTWLAGEPPKPVADFAKAMAKALGTGARVEEGRIVIQGDLTARAAAFLEGTPGTSVVLATR